MNKWYEVIMLDPSSPHIKADKDLNWVCQEVEYSGA